MFTVYELGYSNRNQMVAFKFNEFFILDNKRNIAEKLENGYILEIVLDSDISLHKLFATNEGYQHFLNVVTFNLCILI